MLLAIYSIFAGEVWFIAYVAVINVAHVLLQLHHFKQTWVYKDLEKAGWIKKRWLKLMRYL